MKLSRVFLIVAMMSCLGTAVRADTRVALVIGNSRYTSVDALPNPRKDAALVAATLKREGFAVTLVQDATRPTLLDALNAFNDQADKADWALVYYAGHGMEMSGINYLLPTDVRLRTDRDVQDEAVSLSRVLDTVANARKLRIVVLDACRDNIFAEPMRRTMAQRSIGRGLAPIEPSSGVLVVFAAEAGATAEDGTGEHSPFTTALVQRLQQPGLEVNRLFNLVTADVLHATGQHQRPYQYGSNPSEEEFFFTPPLPTPTLPSREDQIWSWLKTRDDIASITAFRDGLAPGSPLRADVESVLSGLKARNAPAPVEANGIPSEVATTLQGGPSGPPIAGRQRAALLVDAPDDPQRVHTYVGSVVWRVVSVNSDTGGSALTTLKAEIDIPDAKLKVDMLMQKNLESRLPASHTIEFHFSRQAENTLGPVKQINAPEMRKDDDASMGEPLAGVPVTITDDNFLVGLKRATAESQNARLIADRNWFDVSMLFTSGKLGKLTFEKGSAGPIILKHLQSDPTLAFAAPSGDDKRISEALPPSVKSNSPRTDTAAPSGASHDLKQALDPFPQPKKVQTYVVHPDGSTSPIHRSTP